MRLCVSPFVDRFPDESTFGIPGERLLRAANGQSSVRTRAMGGARGMPDFSQRCDFTRSNLARRLGGTLALPSRGRSFGRTNAHNGWRLAWARFFPTVWFYAIEARSAAWGSTSRYEFAPKPCYDTMTAGAGSRTSCVVAALDSGAGSPRFWRTRLQGWRRTT